MPARPQLDHGQQPKYGGTELRRVGVAGPAGSVRIITPRMRQAFGAHASLLGRSASPVAAVSEHTSAAHGLEFGFYLDHAGAVHHVHEEREQIEGERNMLRAADNGLMRLSNSDRDKMERRIELLDRWDALQQRRLSGGLDANPGPRADLV